MNSNSKNCGLVLALLLTMCMMLIVSDFYFLLNQENTSSSEHWFILRNDVCNISSYMLRNYINVRCCLFNIQGGWYVGPTVTPQLNITGLESLLSVQRRIHRHLLRLAWLQMSLEFCSEVSNMQGVGYLGACIFQIVFAISGLPNHIGVYLGKVCWGSGPLFCLTSDRQTDTTPGKGKAREIIFCSAPSLLWRMQ